jgi:thymidine kinase
MTQNKKCRVELIVGCMFSGKSTEGQRRLDRHKFAEKQVFTITHASDTRYGGNNNSCTHSGQRQPAFAASCIVNPKPEELLPADSKLARVVLVDEAQFFPDLVEFVRHPTKVFPNLECLIICGLDGTSDKTPFKAVVDILPLVDTVVKLSAVCSCGDDAIFTARKDHAPGRVEVGGADIYAPVCRACYDVV